MGQELERQRAYALGMRVLVRGQEWLVKGVERNTLGNDAVRCVGVSQLVRGREAVFLSDLDEIEPIDPKRTRFVEDESPHFRRTRLYLESQLRTRAASGSALTVGHRAAMDTLPYQFAPANQALDSLRQRILIADGTGLGKTLEAGILMSELIARGKGRRILVVTAKSMLEQFQREMWDRFTIPLVRLDSAKITQVRAQLPANANPFYYYDKVIVSIDTIKRSVEYGVHLEKSHWDIVVIDEAQNVADRGGATSQRAKLARRLADCSDALIMLSATPHDGSSKSFASLMRMLDPTAIADPDNYGPNDIKGLFVRRFKNDVRAQTGGTFLERDVQMVSRPASPAEERAFERFAELNLAMDSGGHKSAGQLFKITVEKALFSSPAACAETLEERLARMRRAGVPDQSGDAAQLEALLGAVREIDAQDFSRYQGLLGLLRDPEYGWRPEDPEDRVVVFTERIATMSWVAEHLRGDLDLPEDAVVTLDGGMSDAEQMRVVEQFGRRDAAVRVLVASDVASEGINLHYFCHRLVHFDTPWSLMVFQQRNGRIDRYGQRRRPLIRFLTTEARNERVFGDAHILKTLIEKERQAADNIGDPALLMGKFSVDEEENVVREAIAAGADGIAALESSLETAAAPTALDLLLKKAAGRGSAVSTGGPATLAARTLMDDATYLDLGLREFGEEGGVLRREPLAGCEGERLHLDRCGELARRLQRVMPGSVAAGGADSREVTLVLSPDKRFCMEEAERVRRGEQLPGQWAQAQYLWSLHPVFGWVADKAATRLFSRDEAPLATTDRIAAGSVLYLVSGVVPNKRSAPVVDEWMGILFAPGGGEASVLDIEEALRLVRLDRDDVPNRRDAPAEAFEWAALLCPDAVEVAASRLDEACRAYDAKTRPRVDEELGKLAALRDRHKDAQLQLLSLEHARSRKEREIDELFDRFVEQVSDTLEIEPRPSLKVWAAFWGVSA